ncbi:LOW QUALITY PROTEIN: zinc finger protein 503-like [Ptychodera flava]|uniref:LOW QUALITY PROTEIN: zinc finger protein 503-like n=1 Tax=Ptychodera flava TaxID=63121 RepID=UPI00396AA7E2
MSNFALVKPLENNEEKPRSDPERQAKRLPIRAIKMLSARSQHILHTEYLQPLPTPPTYDAKKSPLALLAQTCSSIGKPDPRPSTANTDTKPTFDSLTSKSTASEKANTTTSVTGSNKSSFTPYKQTEIREGDAEITKLAYPSSKGHTSPVTAATPTSRSDGKPAAAASPHRREPLTTSTAPSPKSSGDSPTSSPHNHISHTGISLSCGSMHVEVNHHESSGKLVSHPSNGYSKGESSPVAGLQAPPTLVPVPAAGTVPAPATSACGCTPQVIGHAIPLVSDPNSASPTMRAAMAAAAAQCTPSKNGLGSSPVMAASAPYTTAYARVRTSDGGTTLMPICSDPYCKNCQSAQLSAAAANCTQCRHEPTPSIPGINGAIPIALPLTGTHFPTYAFPNGATTTPSYLYPHTMTLPAATQMAPGRDHVCNWVSGTTSCGKRFATSEELLQHLRTHTMASSDSISTHAIATSLAGALNPCHFYYASAAASPATALTRSSITGGALSPLSTLRYHPYKTSGLGAAASPAAAAYSSIPLPTAAYYSPYQYFDLKQRLPTAVPH